MSEEHDQRLIETIGCDEHSLPFVPFLNLDVIVPPSYIYLGEVLSSFQLVDESQDEGERIGVLNCVLIEVPIVLARVEPSIFCLNKEEGRGLWRLQFLDFARLKMFVNELLTCVHLFRVQGIGFGDFQHKGLLKVDGVIKGTLRREDPCCGFIKHLGVVLTLGREKHLLGSGSLGKRG